MEPVTSAETDKIDEDICYVIPSCGMTRAQTSTMIEDTRASIDMGDKQDTEKASRSKWIVIQIRTEMVHVVWTKANGVWGQMWIGAPGRLQSARGEVITKMIVVMTPEGAVFHELVNHMVMWVAKEIMFIMIEDFSETFVITTEDPDVAPVIVMCL